MTTLLLYIALPYMVWGLFLAGSMECLNFETVELLVLRQYRIMEAQAQLLDSEHEVVINPPVYSGYLTTLTNFKIPHVQFHPWIWGHLWGDFGHQRNTKFSMSTGSGDYINFSEKRMEDAVKACKNGISITQFSWGTACNLIWPTPLVHAYLGVKPITIL